ncbi:hypothetical protein HPB47_014783 [Ixodes persulcatus]|uniref:Uncharacterized protein n=1 Tax=Ixodes persulcatus TaxID=34615 RepID=A0AC60QV53_IXOPE|nr:hypothetical protein HPB47_014783 [Ixodes persulcatus]
MMNVEAVGERVSVLGEGPHWDNRSSTLIYVDVLKREIVRFDPQTKTESVVSSQGALCGARSPSASVDLFLAYQQ